MAILAILQYPDKRLRRVSVPVEVFDQSVQQTIDDMFETHYATPNCAALAATQLDTVIPWRITVIDASVTGSTPLCLVNPQIVAREGEQYEYEGCMSVYPDFIHDRVKRSEKIRVKAQDRDGKPLEFEATGYFAKCIQHELDHLDGRVFIDHLHTFKQAKVNRKIKLYLRTLKNNASEY